MKHQIEIILSLYNIKPRQIFSPQTGYRNQCFKIETLDGQLLNLIIYKQELGILRKIRNANYVSDHLARLNISTRKTILSDTQSIIELGINRNSKLSIQHSEFRKNIANRKNKLIRYCCLYNYLPGKTIPWEGYTMKHIKLLGKTLSDMHYTLKSLPQKNVPDFKNEMIGLNEQMRKYFSDEGVKDAMRQKLNLEINESKNFQKPNSKIQTEEKFQKLNYKNQTNFQIPNYKFSTYTNQSTNIFDYFNNLFTILDAKPKQILHMDFVRSNVLFENFQNTKPPNDQIISKSLNCQTKERKLKKLNTKYQKLNKYQKPKTKSHILDNSKCDPRDSILSTLDAKPQTLNLKLLTLNSELRISGILDFEKTLYGPVILDIARTLAFLIVDCKYKTEEKVRKYFLHSGYIKRGKNKLIQNYEFRLMNYELNCLMTFFWFYDFYKFLKHNVYEGLEKNEHFVRTKNILLAIGLLEYFNKLPNNQTANIQRNPQISKI
jgi:hypothetical protein